MEALQVSGSISKLSAISRGVYGTPAQSQNSGFTTSSSSCPVKFCHHATGHRKQRKFSRVATATSADGGSGPATGSGGLGDMVHSKRGKVVLASLASALANVGILSSSALAVVDYDEVVGNVKQAASSTSDSLSVPDVDASGLLDLVGSNPLVLVAGGAVLALPLIVSTVFKSPEGYGTVSAKQAYEKLGDEELGAQLLDIRVPQDIVFEGTPNLKDYKKKVTQFPCTEVSEEYIDKVLAKFKFKDPENATIYILDRFDGNSLAVAKVLAKSGIKAFAVKAGTEGPGGWQASELPWLEPSKGFSLKLGELLPSSPDAGSVGASTLGVAAAAGVGLVFFSEVETVLQLLGSAVLLQLFSKKFLFAKDRKKTYEEIQTFLDTKVAPKGFVDEIKGIAGTILPKIEEAKVATANGAASFENSVATADAKISEAGAEISEKSAEISEAVKTEEPPPSTAEPEPEPETQETPPVAEIPPPPPPPPAETSPAPLESTPVAEAPAPPPPSESKGEEGLPGTEVVRSSSTNISADLPRTSRPLSPYGQYPGLKPPTSPSPSRP